MENEDLVVKYRPHAVKMAMRFCDSMTAVNVDYGDAAGAAIEALVDTGVKFRPPSHDGVGAAFWMFARRKIYGALRDMMRKDHPLIGGRRYRLFAHAQAFVSLETVRLEEGDREENDYAGTIPFPESLKVHQLDPSTPLGVLPPRELLTMKLYYRDGMNNAEIGDVLGVGEARASQIRTHGLKLLRAQLEARGVRKVSDVL
jgi:DNA-directed RNA polymerase specialized sigma subunit